MRRRGSRRLPNRSHGFVGDSMKTVDLSRRLSTGDRILLAQAQMLGASLLTCDRVIIAYAARTPGIPVCDARG